jgi:hypothetical protein
LVPLFDGWFALAIYGQRPSPVAPATFSDGVAGMAVMDAIRASARQNGKLVTV